MYQVFKSLIVSDTARRNIDLYGCIVSINRRLSNDIVRKRLANCFVYTREHDKGTRVNGRYFSRDSVSHWLGYLLHRDNDKPALIVGNYRIWYQYCKLHRNNDKLTFIMSDNYREWYKNGKLHRDNDQPAFIMSDGRQKWYKNGKEYFPDLEK